MSRKVMYTNLL